ncbi:30S ribosomal protein S5 [Candidatus Falkowbacteria bacterium]|nr:30S ribosomal protein S5 [Candidatus Falkowbacteria bacterium]
MKPESEFEQKIIDLARVTRVMAGGKRMRFRACVAIGDKKGRVGYGLAKGADVTIAVNKAVTKAKKTMIAIPIVNETIPHQIHYKFKAAKLLMKPAPKGTGIKAGGAMRVMLELAGVPNIVGKILGTGNKVTNVKALMIALTMFKPLRKEKKKETEAEEQIKNQVENKSKNKMINEEK